LWQPFFITVATVAATLVGLLFVSLSINRDTIGYWIFIAGVLFRWYSIFYLGKFFTPNVVIQQKHQLIEAGPYRFIRHPTYTGALVALLGVTLTMGNLLSLLIIFIPIVSVMVWRIRIEEAALLEAFGEQYRNYMQRTKRLIPLIY